MTILEIYVNRVGADSARLDFSSPELAQPERPFGYAFLETLGWLGLEPLTEQPNGLPRLRLFGSIETVRDNLPKLACETGGIALRASQKDVSHQSYDRLLINEALANLTSEVIPRLGSRDLAEVCLAIAHPLANKLYGHAHTFIDQEPPWQTDRVRR